MTAVTDIDAPPGSLLADLAAARGAFTDAYTLRLPRPCSQATFIEAFYTTRLFRLERVLLTLAGHASTDDQAHDLARGARERFAAWTVEARAPDELLLADASGVTRSWLKTAPDGQGGTWLCFGSALIPRRRGPAGEPRFGWGFHALVGLHRAYSRALLRAAARRLLA